MKLSAILARFDDPKPERDGWIVRCPAHPDGHPSLLVGQAEDGRILMHCRAGCTTRAVVAALGLEMRDLFNDNGPDPDLPAAKVDEKAPLPEPSKAAAGAYIARCHRHLMADTDLAAQARQYLSNRFGAEEDTIRTFRIGLDPGGDWARGVEVSGPHAAVPRIIFPFYDFDGSVVGVQGRDLTGTHKVRWTGLTNPDGSSWSRYGVFDIGTGLDTIIITEGPGDALTAASHGIDALCIRGAAVAKSDDLAEHLRAALKGRRIVLAGDNDDAGRQFNATLVAALKGLDVYTLDWGGRAVNDITEWRGVEDDFTTALRDAVEGARSASSRRARPQPLTTRHDLAATLASTTPVYERAIRAAQLAPKGLDAICVAAVLDVCSINDEPTISYTDEVGFLVWTSSGWRIDTAGTMVKAVIVSVMTRLLDTIRYDPAPLRQSVKAVLRLGNTDDDEAQADNIIKRLDHAAQSALVDTVTTRVLNALKSSVSTQVSEWDQHHDLLEVANGVLDLRTGTLSPHDHRLRITKRLEVEWDPTARCDLWERFLGEVLDHEVAAFMQRLIGYGVTGHTSEQCFAILYGTGGNGKSVFNECLRHVFGPIMTNTPFSTFEAKQGSAATNDLAALRGARIVTSIESDVAAIMAEATLKNLTGQDMVTARFLYKEFFHFRPTFLILLTTNHKPRFRGQDEGLWRRVKLIGFDRTIPAERRDGNLVMKLRAEAAGILRWAVEGAQVWYRDGLMEPDAIREATAEYREVSDDLAGFLDWAFEPDPDGKVPPPAVYAAYKTWATKEMGWSEVDLWSARGLYRALEDRGLRRRKMKVGGESCLAFVGVSLRPERTKTVAAQ